MMQRGDIYFVNLSPTQGREQTGYRPVLVVSADAINRQPLVVTVVVGTSATRVPRNYPTNVRVTAAETGLPHDTVFLCFQLRSLDPSRFIDQQTWTATPRRDTPDEPDARSGAGPQASIATAVEIRDLMRGSDSLTTDWISPRPRAWMHAHLLRHCSALIAAARMTYGVLNRFPTFLTAFVEPDSVL